ncbi:MAG: hypothetical protein HY726_16580 [Candidatus Rokubacteria bacterium]|nr:hypothetical protein [Candidatus Rokubacteria bacterium]
MTEMFNMTEMFKAVEWMRHVRTQIDAEDAGLGWSDKHQKTIKILEKDPLWHRLKSRMMDSRAKAPEGR